MSSSVKQLITDGIWLINFLTESQFGDETKFKWRQSTTSKLRPDIVVRCLTDFRMRSVTTLRLVSAEYDIVRHVASLAPARNQAAILIRRFRGF